jgi:hypothetical protein
MQSSNCRTLAATSDACRKQAKGAARTPPQQNLAAPLSCMEGAASGPVIRALQGRGALLVAAAARA